MKNSAIFLLALFAFPPAQAQNLPDGKGKDVTDRICGACHEAGVVSKYHYSKDDWLGVVEDMKGRGAAGSDQDFETIVAYLTHFFGPEVHINQATAKEIATQLEIPAGEADAIVKHRDAQGAFRSFDDLKKVPGLDTKELEPLRQRIVFN